MVRKFDKKIKCSACKSLKLAESGEVRCSYLEKLSHGGLILPGIDLKHYVAKAFAILDTAILLIRDSIFCERYAAEHVLRLNDYATSFLCDEHQVVGIKFVSRIVTKFILTMSRNSLLMKFERTMQWILNAD